MTTFPYSEAVMQRALDLARRGVGSVEPNPPVGAVIVDDDLNEIATGFHARFGGPHAEIDALSQAGDRARGQTMFVTLEPCCHHGKTGPCTDAILAAGIKKVVVARVDPAEHAAGQGIAKLREHGLDVDVGLLEHAARKLTAPFAKWITLRQPYVHAKWAMSLDGKIATATGHSQWISNETSRAKVHELRGRMDAVIVGIGTALADDPLLSARPAGLRTATRIVVDALARLPIDSKLVRTVVQAPVLVACTTAASDERIAALQSAGVEVVKLPPCEMSPNADAHVPLSELMQELGRRSMTNVLIEGGSRVLGSAFTAELIDEYHVFIAPKIVGGVASLSPIGGDGLPQIPTEPLLEPLEVEELDGDLYVHAQTIAAVMR